MTNRREKAVVGAVSIASLAVLALAFFTRGVTGMLIYDTHMEKAEALNRALTADQRKFVGFCFDYIADGYLTILVVTNLLWMGAVCYLWWRRTRESSNDSKA